MDTHRLARTLAIGRVVLGTSAVLATKLFATVLAGSEAAENDVTRITGRLYGIRELALGLAQLKAIRQGQPLEPYLRLGLHVDSSDAFFTFLGRRALPLRGQIIGLGIAGGYAALEARALSARQAG